MAMVSKEEDGQEDGAACKHEGRQFGDKKAKSCRTLNISFLFKVIPLGDLVLFMENLHAKGPSRNWQLRCSVSSPLNSSSGRVESGWVAFRNWQHSRFRLESCSTVRAAALRAVRWFAGSKHTRQAIEDPSSRRHGLGIRADKPARLT